MKKSNLKSRYILTIIPLFTIHVIYLLGNIFNLRSVFIEIPLLLTIIFNILSSSQNNIKSTIIKNIARNYLYYLFLIVAYIVKYKELLSFNETYKELPAIIIIAILSKLLLESLNQLNSNLIEPLIKNNLHSLLSVLIMLLSIYSLAINQDDAILKGIIKLTFIISIISIFDKNNTIVNKKTNYIFILLTLTGIFILFKHNTQLLIKTSYTIISSAIVMLIINKMKKKTLILTINIITMTFLLIKILKTKQMLFLQFITNLDYSKIILINLIMHLLINKIFTFNTNIIFKKTLYSTIYNKKIISLIIAFSIYECLFFIIYENSPILLIKRITMLLYWIILINEVEINKNFKKEFRTIR